MIKKVLGVILIAVVIAALLPVLLPLLFDSIGDIDAITHEDAGAELALLKTIWPIVVMVIIIGIAAGLVFFALKRFGVIK